MLNQFVQIVKLVLDLTENIDCNRDKIWVNGHCKPDFLEFESEATMAKLEPRNSFKIQHSEAMEYGINDVRNEPFLVMVKNAFNLMK
uniref:RNase H domain-containing protein n=1 Tax=Loa loa TaxID=7209 RepID=A0A1I7VAU4_LOALO